MNNAQKEIKSKSLSQQRNEKLMSLAEFFKLHNMTEFLTKFNEYVWEKVGVRMY